MVRRLAFVRAGEFAAKIVAVVVDHDRQGLEGPGLEPLAEVVRQGGHLRRIARRMISLVELVVTRLDLLDLDFLLLQDHGAGGLALSDRQRRQAVKGRKIGDGVRYRCLVSCWGGRLVGTSTLVPVVRPCAFARVPCRMVDFCGCSAGRPLPLPGSLAC